MPTSILSSSLSWGAYFAAALGLLAAVSPVLTTVGRSADELAARNAVVGVAAVLNGMMPGVSVSFTIPPGAGPAITLDGRNVLAESGGKIFTASTTWTLASVSLYPGLTYRFSVNGTEVVVTTNV